MLYYSYWEENCEMWDWRRTVRICKRVNVEERLCIYVIARAVVLNVYHKQQETSSASQSRIKFGRFNELSVSASCLERYSRSLSTWPVVHLDVAGTKLRCQLICWVSSYTPIDGLKSHFHIIMKCWNLIDFYLNYFLTLQMASVWLKQKNRKVTWSINFNVLYYISASEYYVIMLETSIWLTFNPIYVNYLVTRCWT